MKTLTVDAGKGYPIIIENNIFSTAGKRIRAVTAARKVCVVSDSNVFPLYGAALEQQLAEENFTVSHFIFEAGEASKTPSTAAQLVEYLAKRELTRSDIVVALGGGVTGDIAGFASAIYLRGIDFVQIPTSLLAQVDASVGGKTAVNLPQGKNLCGAFHQPILVLIDPLLLNTLPSRYFTDAIAEAIKMASLMPSELWCLLSTGELSKNLETVIEECVRLKTAMVEQDETEHGVRALLNFGHTVGHAIEKLNGFETVTHGEAVAIGMVMVTKASEENGITEPGTAKRLAAVLQQYDLPTTDAHSVKAIVEAMCADKKRTGDSIRLIVLKTIGEAVIYPIAYDALGDFFGVTR